MMLSAFFLIRHRPRFTFSKIMLIKWVDPFIRRNSCCTVVQQQFSQMIFRMKNENFQGLLWSFFREKYVQQQSSSKKSPWFGITLGGAKETAPVINIEINGVRGIWLTFLEWVLWGKNWTHILLNTKFIMRTYKSILCIKSNLGMNPKILNIELLKLRQF